MAITSNITDRFSSGMLYILMALVTLWSGFRLLNHGLEVRFFKDYLLQWEVGLQAFSSQQSTWPAFSGSNHAAYMDALVRRMKNAGVALPDSNTPAAYRYRIERFGARDEDIFVLCFHDRIVLYGISKTTLGRIDEGIDRHSDLLRGRVSGWIGKNSKTYIGMWRL